MEAQRAAALLIAFAFLSLGANYSTRNFVVLAHDPSLAREVGEQAEKYRQQLAQFWLGHELPDWPQRCPIHVQIGSHAGGETSFLFVTGPDGRSRPTDWRMKIFGPADRLLDSVLPHEVTHTVFATHFGRPLPRWADEGACTTVEHQSEKDKNHRMLKEFLTSDRGIPFNHMFAMKQYPDDILPLYSQGYSLARFLIMTKGPRHFVDYIGAGMKREIPGREPETWNRVTADFYGFDDLSDLQVTWLDWVRKKCPDLTAEEVTSMLPGSAPDLNAEFKALSGVLPTSTPLAKSKTDEGWYVRQMNRPKSELVSSTVPTTSPSMGYRPGSTGGTLTSDPISRQTTVWR